jgi:hypothetical protein
MNRMGVLSVCNLLIWQVIYTVKGHINIGTVVIEGPACWGNFFLWIEFVTLAMKNTIQ